MTMREAIQEFGFDCKIRKLSQKTISNYQKQLKYLQRFLESEFGVKDVFSVNNYGFPNAIDLYHGKAFGLKDGMVIKHKDHGTGVITLISTRSLKESEFALTLRVEKKTVLHSWLSFLRI